MQYKACSGQGGVKAGWQAVKHCTSSLPGLTKQILSSWTAHACGAQHVCLGDGSSACQLLGSQFPQVWLCLNTGVLHCFHEAFLRF